VYAASEHAALWFGAGEPLRTGDLDRPLSRDINNLAATVGVFRGRSGAIPPTNPGPRLQFERWLDGGIPEDSVVRSAASAHAALCPGCSAALETARVLESLLAMAPAAPPEGFSDRVVARVIAAERLRASAALVPPAPAMPWWVRAMLDPATACSLCLAAVLVAAASRAGAIASAIEPGARAVLALAVRSLESLHFGPLSPVAETGIALAAAPVAVLGSMALLHWMENRVAASLLLRVRSGRRDRVYHLR